MAGEIGTNYYNQSLYNQFNNPYLMKDSSSMNDDFMAQSVFGDSAQQAALANYANAFKGSNLQGQPTSDTYQASSNGGGSSIGSTLLTGAAIGGATGAGFYFWGTNPMKDGKINPSFLEALNKQNVENSAILKFNELYKTQVTPIFQKVGIAGVEQYNAVQKLAGLTKLEDLPQEIRSKLPTSIQTPEAAKQAIDQIKPELAKIDTEKLIQKAAKTVRPDSLAFHQTQLRKLQGLESQVKALKPEATVEELTTFFKNNAAAYGLKGTQVEVATKAEKLANTFKTQENLLNNISRRASFKQAHINRINLALEQQFKNHWDEGAKAFKEGAPKELGEALKNFKWKKAGKAGLIAAGVAIVGKLLFGGKSEA